MENPHTTSFANVEHSLVLTSKHRCLAFTIGHFLMVKVLFFRQFSTYWPGLGLAKEATSILGCGLPATAASRPGSKASDAGPSLTDGPIYIFERNRELEK